MADGSLIFDTKLDSTGFKDGMSKMKGLALTTAGAITKSIGIVGAATAALGGFAIKAGMSFDAGMSEVSAISGATGKDLEMLREKAKEMGATTKFSATESAEALKYMAMAGWKPQQMMQGLEGVMNLAAASGENLGMVSDIVTDSLTAFGLEAKDANQFVDLLAKTATSTNTNVSMLGESFKYIAPVAKAAGFSAKDTALALGLLANNGIKGSQAGTVLRSAFLRLAKPTKEVAKGLQDVGLTAQDLQDIPLPDMLSKLREGFKGLTNSQKLNAAASIFGKEAASGMLAIIETSSEEVNRLSKEFDNSSGAAEKMAKIMNDNLKGDITILKSALEGFSISLYENVDNPLRQIAQKATKYIDKLNETVKKDISKLPQVIGDILGDIATNLASQLPKFAEIGSKIILGLLQGIQTNSNKIGNSLATLAEVLITNILKISEKMITTGAALLLKFGEGLTKGIPKIMKTATDVINNLLDFFINNVDKFFKVGTDVLLKIAEGLEQNLPKILPKAIDAMVKLLVTFSQNIERFLEIGIKIVNAIIQGLIAALPRLLSNADKIVNALLKIFLAFKAVSVGKKIVSEIASGLLKNSSLVKTATKKLIDDMILNFNTHKPIFLSQAKSLIATFTSGLNNASGGLISAGSGLLGKLTAGMTGAFGKITAIGGKIIATLVSVLSNPIGLAVVGGIIVSYIVGSFDLTQIAAKGGEIIGSLIRGIFSMLPKLWEAVKSIVTGIAKMLNPVNWVKAGVNLVKGLVNGITGKKEEVKQATKETVEKGANEGANSADVSQSPKQTIQQLVQGIKNGETDVAQSFKQLVEKGLTNSEINQLALKAGQTTNDSYLQGLLSNGESGLRTAYNNLRTTTSNELEIITKLAKLKGIDTLNGFTDGVASDGTKLEDVIKSLRDKGLTGFDLAEKVFELGQKGTLKYGEGISAQQQAVQEKAKLIAETARNPLEFAEQAFSQGLINMEKFGNGLAEGMQFVQKYIQDGILQGKSYLEISEELRQMGLTNMNAFSDGTNGGLIPIQQAYQQLKQMGVSETLIPEILQANGYTNVNGLSMGLASGKSLLESTLITSINDPLLQSLQQGQTDANSGGNDVSRNIASGISSGGGNVKTEMGYLTKYISDGMEKAKSNSGTKSKEMMSNISSNVKSGVPAVVLGIAQMAQNVDSNLNNLKSTSSSTMTSTMSGLSSSVKSGSNDVKSSMNDMAKGINTELSNMARNVTQDTSRMMSDTASTVSSGASKVQSSFSSMCSSSISSINGFSGQFYSAGSNLVHGLANGISAGRSSALGAAVSVMRGAIAAAKSAAGIHSPSRVMRDEVGIMLSKGLGIGIEKEGRNVLHSAKDFISEIISKMQGSVDLEMNTLFNGGRSYKPSFNIDDNGNSLVSIKDGTIVVVSQLDGREIGRVTAPFVSRELSKEKRR